MAQLPTVIARAVYCQEAQGNPCSVQRAACSVGCIVERIAWNQPLDMIAVLRFCQLLLQLSCSQIFYCSDCWAERCFLLPWNFPEAKGNLRGSEGLRVEVGVARCLDAKVI